MSLLRYVIKRLISIVPTLLALSLIMYYVASFFPAAQRVALFIPTNPYRYPGQDIFSSIPLLIEKYHLNDPFYVHYFIWLQGILKGNLGYSFLYSTSVVNVILSCLPATLELILFSAPIIFFGGYKIGVFLADRASKKASKEDSIDFAVRTISIFGYSIPQFCIGLLLLVIFYWWLGWVQPERLSQASKAIVFSPNWRSYTGLYTLDAILNGQLTVFLDALKHLALPVITLSIQIMPIVIRVTRSAVLGELGMPYTIAARAKGLQEKEIVKCVRKNSLGSILTVSGVLFSSMLTGIVVIENVFVIKGIGYQVVRAASRYDFPLLIGISLVTCVAFIITNLLVDLAYAYLNPRIRW